MKFAIIGLIASLMSPLVLRWRLPRDYQFPSRLFLICVGLSVIANAVAFWGFRCLTSGPAIPNGDYHAVIEILGLLSAGAIAGFWGIDYQKAPTDEKVFLNIISSLFVFVFYVLFISICYYIGKSEELQKTPKVSLVVPGIMLLLLEINAVIDIWDYRKLPER
jgi:hypothetical protein